MGRDTPEPQGGQREVRKSEGHTTAGQQTRTSYLWAGLRPSRRYQDSAPCGLSWLGNATGNAFFKVEFSDDRVSSLSVWSVGPMSGSLMMLGAMKMTFSVLVRAVVTNSEIRQAPLRSFMVVNDQWSVSDVENHYGSSSRDHENGWRVQAMYDETHCCCVFW